MKTGAYAAAAAVVVFSGLCLGYQDDSRTKLTGTWQADGGASPAAETWVIEEKDDSIRITHTAGDQKPVELECNTMGRECKIKDAGKKATVSMWFAGPKLVQLETRGSDIVKRSFAVSDDGNTLNIEMVPVVPAGKSETAHFKRAPMAAAQK